MLDWVTAGVALILALAVAAVTHRIAFSLLQRVARHAPGQADEIVVARVRTPSRWIFVGIAMAFAIRGLDLAPWAEKLWQQIAGFLVPGLIGWFAIAIIQAYADIAEVRYDISVADNLQARRRRTRIGILTRILIFAVLFLTVAMMLLSIPSIRNVGFTLMASAGLAGLAVGAAAQPALKNFIAGAQLAFTEPIRLDDVIIMDNEWGRIEEIKLTYVVVRIWDDRRLVVPVARFLEESFQNWTRSTSQLMGSVFIRLDWSADVPRIRQKAGELIAANPRWDRRFWNVQVTDATAEAMELRVLMTAADASLAFDLRCDIREGLISFIATDMPEALPRHRQHLGKLDDIRMPFVVGDES
ncbi:mechanosensitive ion channel [Sphingomonas crocodyli]|uniref:Mechanosensitive ion channel n=2 Tax=Sphingomonas crocodyli TaxID=1979270 RepID=A0A437LYR5_9SPHN|nr:mechanosensitive ion channel [Sphingomonas crocodyli]